MVVMATLLPQVVFFCGCLGGHVSSLQVLCVAEQVLFTERCEEAIVAGRLNELLIEQEAQLDAYTNTSIQVCCTCT